MHHYPFHPGDYMLDTAHLEPMEDLAYRRLLDSYYTSEVHIPLETQSVARRLRLGCEVIEKVLVEFFERTESGWKHRRCDAEIASYKAMAERNRTNGKQGGRPKKTQRVASGNPVATQPRTKNQNQELEPNETPVVPKGTVWSPSVDQKIVNGFFRRRDSTRWDRNELAAWKRLQPIDQGDFGVLGRFYTGPQKPGQFRRTTHFTLFNNWQGEIDKARAYAENPNPAHNGKHPAYNSATATAGLTREQVLHFTDES